MGTKRGYLIPILIHLIDDERTALNDLIGKDDDLEIKQVPLKFVSIDCFWVDPEINKDSETQDIIFYINGSSFRTPFTKERINFFNPI